jgi:hypothetical protein
MKIKWIFILGTASLTIGLTWLGIWSYPVQGGEPVGSIAYELHPPTGSRLMILVGVVTLVVATIALLLRRLRKFLG